MQVKTLKRMQSRNCSIQNPKSRIIQSEARPEQPNLATQELTIETDLTARSQAVNLTNKEIAQDRNNPTLPEFDVGGHRHARL